MCLGVGSRCFGAEPLLSSWDGRERHGTGLWTGTHTTDERTKQPPPPPKNNNKKKQTKETPKYTREEMDVRTIKCEGVTIYSFVVSSGPSAGKEHLSLGA